MQVMQTHGIQLSLLTTSWERQETRVVNQSCEPELWTRVVNQSWNQSCEPELWIYDIFTTRFILSAERLQKFFIDISDNSDGSSPQVCANDSTPYESSETRVYCCPLGTTGRDVRIRFEDTYNNYIQLCEVQVQTLATSTYCCVKCRFRQEVLLLLKQRKSISDLW